MREVLKAGLLSAMVLTGSVAHAGGPVIIEEGNDELVVAKPARSAGILPVLGLLVLACIVACGGGGDGDDSGSDPVETPK
ncbi:hypothetical protein [Rhodobacter calidifons]|uniref:Lipoprotein n=1 Tax=Rhodobacter calidifons TaxID=2715277 RepID=A0ABX0G997_9RHOB|nr:hypothetical protein [Rhodobacter calidifons]NHB77816.1 hypothetical protein [Rhodobacter calidifons]